MPFANNKGRDQPGHPRSLISAFVIHCLDSIISIRVKSRISRLKLVSVAKQTGLSLTCPKPWRQIFSWQGSNHQLPHQWWHIWNVDIDLSLCKLFIKLHMILLIFYRRTYVLIFLGFGRPLPTLPTPLSLSLLAWSSQRKPYLKSMELTGSTCFHCTLGSLW